MTLPGSIRADFPCTLIHQALTPSPLECEYFYTNTVGGIMHEFCGELDLSTEKDVKGGSWSKKIPHVAIFVKSSLKNHQMRQSRMILIFNSASFWG